MTTKRVFSIHYTLTGPQGDTLDSSSGGEPLMFLEGVGQIIPGLESEVIQMKVGDKRVVKVPSAEAYGEHDEQLVIQVPRAQIPKADVAMGDMFQVESQDAPPFMVVEVNESHVLLDGNHPLAGVDLTFDVELTAVREASAEELAHGHAHGAGGHHH